MDTLTAIIILIGKISFCISTLLGFASITTWVERKGSALIQNRVGANRARIFGFDLAGLFNTFLADPIKGIVKEDWVPKGTSPFMHNLAVFLAVFPVILSFSVIPFGPSVFLEDEEIRLQVVNLNVGLLYVFSMGALAVYGILIAGFVSNNKFSLFGALRGVSQMMSYEVTMGFSVISVILIYQTLDLSEIVLEQSGTFYYLPRWGVFLNPIAFFLFFASVMAETKRAPFDLPESESELVAGYMTEYSGMKFLMFWLGEFSEIVVASSLIVLLFLGGWQLPYFDIREIPSDFWGLLPTWFSDVGFQWAPILGVFIFLTKVFFLCVLQVVIRWTLPRFRYDHLMNFCWKFMLSVSILSLIVTGALVLSGFYGE